MRNDANVLDRLITGDQVEASPEVRELAQLATILQGAWQAGPTKAATNRTRAAALSAFQENGNGHGNGAVAVATPIAVARASRGRRVVARVVLAAALVVALPAAAWAASEDSLPGQLLYPVKRGFEEVRLALAGDPVDEARVLLGMAGERVEETILATALELGAVAEQARQGYEEIVARFQGRIVEAQALGLPVDDVVAEATALFTSYQQVFDAIFGAPPSAPAPQPTEVLSASAPEEEKPNAGSQGGKAESKSKKADGKRDHRANGQGRKGGGAGVGAAGAAGTGSTGSGGQDSGDGGGKGGNGGGNGGGTSGNAGGGTIQGEATTGEDAKEEDPPQADDDDDDEGDDADDDGSDSGSGSGVANGHEKAIGEGHDPANGEGHEGDG